MGAGGDSPVKLDLVSLESFVHKCGILSHN